MQDSTGLRASLRNQSAKDTHTHTHTHKHTNMPHPAKTHCPTAGQALAY